MVDTRTVNGYTFKYSKDNNFYECRGEVCYDDEHDEIPEEGLWKAAEQLAEELSKEGHSCAYPEHSEKGWVEVIVN